MDQAYGLYVDLPTLEEMFEFFKPLEYKMAKTETNLTSPAVQKSTPAGSHVMPPRSQDPSHELLHHQCLPRAIVLYATPPTHLLAAQFSCLTVLIKDLKLSRNIAGALIVSLTPMPHTSVPHLLIVDTAVVAIIPFFTRTRTHKLTTALLRQ